MNAMLVPIFWTFENDFCVRGMYNWKPLHCLAISVFSVQKESVELQIWVILKWREEERSNEKNQMKGKKFDSSLSNVKAVRELDGTILLESRLRFPLRCFAILLSWTSFTLICEGCLVVKHGRPWKRRKLLVSKYTVISTNEHQSQIVDKNFFLSNAGGFWQLASSY